MKALRLAFEDASSTEEANMITMKGPLAEVYSEALQKIYAKQQGTNIDETMDNKVVLESQEMDAEVLGRISRMISTGSDIGTDDNSDVAYSISKSDIDNDVIVDLTSELVNHKKKDTGEFFLIVDATMPSSNGEAYSKPMERPTVLLNAVESLAEAFGVKCFPSLESFLRR